MHACVRVCAHKCIRGCMCEVHVCMYVCMCLFMVVFMHVSVGSCVRVHVCIRASVSGETVVSPGSSNDFLFDGNSYVSPYLSPFMRYSQTK